jgi:hypothetical protein
MACITFTRTLVWQSCVGLVLCLLGTVALEGVPRKTSVARPVLPPAHAKAIKRTWHSAPATMPPEVEVVPPRSPFPPSVTLRGSSLDIGQKAAGLKAGVPVRGAPALAVNPARAVQAGNAAVGPERAGMSQADPETRARDELRNLRDDPSSRQAFYDDLRRNVDRVRRGEQDTDPDQKAPIASPPNHSVARFIVQ